MKLSSLVHQTAKSCCVQPVDLAHCLEKRTNAATDDVNDKLCNVNTFRGRTSLPNPHTPLNKLFEYEIDNHYKRIKLHCANGWKIVFGPSGSLLKH